MKFKQIIFGAALLTLMAACTDQLEVNPNYNPETKQVTTNLVLNIALPGSPQTKQNADAVQVIHDAQTTPTFWGIRDAVLLSYQLNNPERILVADSTAVKIDTLGTLATANMITLEQSNRIVELSLPLQTNNLLFYGRAIASSTAYGNDRNYTSSTSSTANYGLYDCYGHLDNFHLSKDAGSAYFDLGKRLQDSEKSEFYAVEKVLAGVLSIIMNTSLKESNHTAISGTIPVAASEYGDLYWSDFARADQKSPVDVGSTRGFLEKKMGDAYTQMTTIYSSDGELRAASAQALERTIQDLWTVINETRAATPMSKGEAVAKHLADCVHDRIGIFFDGEVPANGGPVSGVIFKSNLATKLGNYESAWQRPSASKSYWDVSDAASVVSYNQFPFNYNLPRGATHISFNKQDSCFYYPSTFNTSDMGGTPTSGTAYNAESYYYPAELMYFGNSPIAVSTQNKQKTDFPNGTSNWNENYDWAAKGWSGDHITSATRSVAMKKDIRYATALLKTQVKYQTTSLRDNNHAIQKRLNPGIGDDTEPDKVITVTDNSFFLTGVIIGGQYHRVGWDFLPDTSKGQGFIYDKAIPDNAQIIPADPAASSEPNYTFVFDNCVGGPIGGDVQQLYVPEATQSKVYVALEFLNNTGQDFYGNYNMISDKGFFYLIAELDPDNPRAGTTVTWPTNYVVPPYKADGTSNEKKRVFMQSFMTSAMFILGENSLKRAYLTVPDLRAGSMNLGVSVNLDWVDGLQFDAILGN